MYKRNGITKFIEAFNWASNASKKRQYRAPQNIWQEFLYAMSYNKGKTAEATKWQPAEVYHCCHYDNDYICATFFCYPHSRLRQ